MSIRDANRSSTLAVGLLVAACVPNSDRDPELPPITWSGTHLDYAPQPHAEPICLGTLPYMDRYVELAAAAMDVELDGPVAYVHGSRDDEPSCSLGSLGCTSIDARVYSYLAPHEHELVHAVRSFAGFSQTFFEEGAAEMFGDDAHLPGRGLPTGDLLEGIETARPEGGYWYPRMGHFSAYLHDRHGPAVTTAILRETDRRSSTARTLAVLEAATGMPFDELRADYESEPACDQAHYRYPLYPCDAPEALRPRCEADAAVRIEEHIACDDSTTLGPRQAEIWKYVAFDVPSAGEYTIERAAEVAAPGSSIVIKECSMRCDAIVIERPITGTYWDPDFDPGPPVFLRAGRYALRMTRPADAPSDVAVWIRGSCGA
jgi:hypothetical protein